MDIELNYVEKGSGEAFIMLHGNGEDFSIFKGELEHFSKNYRAIAIDTRGHGKTPLGEEPFTYDQFAKDLNDFMEEQGIEKANILGFSDGAITALIFAYEHPEKVKMLIANGANLSPRGIKISARFGIFVNYIWYSFLSAFSKKFLFKKALMMLMLKKPHIKDEDLQKIEAPTLVLVGTDDMIKESESRHIKATVPESEICFVLGDHFVLKSNPKDYNFAIDKFLEKRLEAVK